MDNSIKIFKNDVFGEVRVAGTSEEPLFCLADVCNAIELSNPSSVKTRLNDEDLQLLDLHALNPDLYVNGNSFATFITESAFYDVLLFSSSKKVKPYRRWVTHEILPSIRKYGAYMTSDTIEKALTSPDFLIQLATTLKEEKQKRIEAEKKVEEQAPKVLFADAVIGSRSSCLIGELAKIISQNGFHVGQNRLFEWLRNNHYLGSVGERRNIPNQQYVEQGLFELKKGTRSGNDGVLRTTITTKVTGKGQSYFINGFLTGKFIINRLYNISKNEL